MRAVDRFIHDRHQVVDEGECVVGYGALLGQSLCKHQEGSGSTAWVWLYHHMLSYFSKSALDLNPQERDRHIRVVAAQAFERVDVLLIGDSMSCIDAVGGFGHDEFKAAREAVSAGAGQRSRPGG